MADLIAAADEQPRALRENESEAVTVAFADARADICGVARVGRAQVDGQLRTSGLALLFAGGETIAVRAESGLPVTGLDLWGDVAVAGIESAVDEPLAAWTVSFTAADGRSGFDLELAATSAPVRPRAPAGVGGGTMEGYEQLVRVGGSVTVNGRDRRLKACGQRGHSWGIPDSSAAAVARTIAVWLNGDGDDGADDGGLSLTALRPAAANGHDQEQIEAVMLGAIAVPQTADGQRRVANGLIVAEPRISTTYDDAGRQRSAGLELYIDAEDPYPLHVAGEVVCGTTLDLGRQRLECAFFRWRSGGRVGVGRYDLLAAAQAPVDNSPV